MKNTFIILIATSFLLLSCNPSNKNEITNSESLSDTLKNDTKSTPTKIKSEETFPFITGEGIGEFQIGTIVPKSVSNYDIKKRVVVEETEEGDYEEPKYFVSQNSEELFVISTKLNYNTEGFSDTISEIQVLSNKIRTKEGITLNENIINFINTYPDHLIWYTYIGAMFVAESPSIEGVQFILDEKGFTGKVVGNKDSEPVKVTEFKKDTKIKKIRIIGKME